MIRRGRQAIQAVGLWALLALACLPGAAAERVALLIGNNNYGSMPLRNASNDARDLGEALKELGFQVIVRENATRKDMVDAIREFGQAIDGASTALFFYAGHAMQFKDRNYLIPIDAAMGSEEDVTFFSVEVGQVFDRMDRARTKFNFLILDACRDNPFAASFKVSSQGLAQMSSPTGTLIAYATAPGSVAADGFGRNGIYTKHILQNIRLPDIPVEIMFKRVREGVERETRRLQTPWDSSSLKGDFVFAAAGATKSGAAAAPGGPSADATLQIEREFWISVRDSNRPEDIRAYLDKYPAGNFAALARNRLDGLVRPSRVAAAEPVTPPPRAATVEAPQPPPSRRASPRRSSSRRPALVRRATARPRTLRRPRSRIPRRPARAPRPRRRRRARPSRSPGTTTRSPSRPKRRPRTGKRSPPRRKRSPRTPTRSPPRARRSPSDPPQSRPARARGRRSPGRRTSPSRSPPPRSPSHPSRARRRFHAAAPPPPRPCASPAGPPPSHRGGPRPPRIAAARWFPAAARAARPASSPR